MLKYLFECLLIIMKIMKIMKNNENKEIKLKTYIILYGRRIFINKSTSRYFRYSTK